MQTHLNIDYKATLRKKGYPLHAQTKTQKGPGVIFWLHTKLNKMKNVFSLTCRAQQGRESGVVVQFAPTPTILMGIALSWK